MKSLKKLVATALTVTLVATGSFAVCAADDGGNLEGTGSVEGVVDKEVFKVELPTVSTNDTTFDFIMDPQGLIEATNGAAYEGLKFESGATVYFANSVSGNDYTSTSEDLKITNKSTMEVNVSLEATVAAVEGLTMAEDADFAADDKEAKLYLAISDGTNTEAITTEAAKITAEMDAAPEDAYEVKYDSEGKEYAYDLTDAAKAEDYDGFATYSFNLEGACNPNGDWKGLDSASPKINVVWTVSKAGAAAAAYESDGTTDIVITYDGAAVSSITVTPKNTTGTTKTAISLTASQTDRVAFAAGKVTLKKAWLAGLISASTRGKGTYTVKIGSNEYEITLK